MENKIWNLQKQKMTQINCHSSLKQNQIVNIKKNTSKLAIKSGSSQAYLTKSLFPSKKNSLKNITNQSSVGISDFFHTLSSGFGNEWSRPQSKRASRRQSNRPQTSKGPRPYLYNQYDDLRQKRASNDLGLLKSTFPSKSMYNCAVLSRQQTRQNPVQQQQVKQLEDELFKNIRIVVTRNQKPRKQKSFYNQKFQTNLPQDFLSLFAD